VNSSALFTLGIEAESFSVTLKATRPVMLAVHAGGAAGFRWSSETICGLYREGSDPTARYMPLYRLKKASF
jgi:hypothetical protein